MRSLGKVRLAERRFAWMAYDDDNCDLMPGAMEVSANDLHHALQKIAPTLPDGAHRVSVWELELAG